MMNFLRKIRDWLLSDSNGCVRPAASAPTIVEEYGSFSVHAGDFHSSRKFIVTGLDPELEWDAAIDLEGIPREGDLHPACHFLIAERPRERIDFNTMVRTVVVDYSIPRKPPVITPDVSRRRWAAYPVPA